MKTLKEMRTEARETLKGKLGNSLLSLVLDRVIGTVATCIPVVGSVLVSGPMQVGVQKMYYDNTKKEKTEWTDVFCGFKDFGENFLLGLAKQVYLLLWSLLFLIPGIVKSYSYSMAEYLKVREPELCATEAITKSRELMNGNKWRLFLLNLSFLGWNLLGVVTLGIAFIFVSPYKVEARTVFFNHVYEEYNNKKEASQEVA